MFLAMSPLHKERALNELRDFVAKHTEYSPDASSRSLSISEKLSLIPPNAWEDGLPFLLNCLDETIRVSGIAVRQRCIMSDDVVVDGKKLELGSFIVSPSELGHNNPDVFPKPEK